MCLFYAPSHSLCLVSYIPHYIWCGRWCWLPRFQAPCGQDFAEHPLACSAPNTWPDVQKVLESYWMHVLVNEGSREFQCQLTYTCRLLGKIRGLPLHGVFTIFNGEWHWKNCLLSLDTNSYPTAQTENRVHMKPLIGSVSVIMTLNLGQVFFFFTMSYCYLLIESFPFLEHWVCKLVFTVAPVPLAVPLCVPKLPRCLLWCSSLSCLPQQCSPLSNLSVWCVGKNVHN